MVISRDGYWRRVHRAALRKARSQVLGAPKIWVTVFAVPLATVGGLWVFVSEEEAKNELISILCVAAAWIAILAIWYVYLLTRIPKELDRELYEYVAELEDKLTPSFRFLWRPDDIRFFEIAPVSYQRSWSVDSWPMTIGRVGVENRSHAATLSGVQVSLVGYQIDGDHGLRPIERQLSAGKPVVELHAGCNETFQVFSTDSGDTCIRLGPFADGSADVRLPPGKYRLTMRASAANMPRVDDHYFLSLDEGSQVEFRPWQEGDTRHEKPDETRS